MTYKFKVGDKLIFKPTNTEYIIINIYYKYSKYMYSLANNTPGVPLRGNMRHIGSKEIFNTYEPVDPAIRLLYYKGD